MLTKTLESLLSIQYETMFARLSYCLVNVKCCIRNMKLKLCINIEGNIKTKCPSYCTNLNCCGSFVKTGNCAF